jgi:hypothetical protein
MVLITNSKVLGPRGVSLFKGAKGASRKTLHRQTCKVADARWALGKYDTGVGSQESLARAQQVFEGINSPRICANGRE